MALNGQEQQIKEAYNQEAFDLYNTKGLEPCGNCGRTFLPESLIKHQKMCKGAGSGSVMRNKSLENK
jgi:hypothetical protein